MRIQQPGQARANAYDRNVTRVGFSIDTGAIAPAGNTVRATYTVPAGRKAFWQSAHTKILRVTAAAPVGAVRNRMFENSSFVVCGSSLLTNGVGDQSISHNAPQSLCIAGDINTMSTDDASTGGTCWFEGGAVFMEFDA